MPQTLAFLIPYIVAGLEAIGVGAQTAAFLAPIILSIATAVGIYEISTLLAPKPKLDSQSAQQPVRQATAPRRRYYGLVKASGIYSFLRAKDNWLYSILMIASQRIDSIVDHWLNDRRVNAYMAPNGDITSGPLALDGHIPIIKLRHRLGLETETVYTEVKDAFPDSYTIDHRGDGVFSALLIEGALASNFSVYYPSGPYAYRAVFKAAQVWDPREIYQDPNDPDTWEWSNNLALCVLDFLRHRDGMRLPFTFFENVIDDWSTQADICDELVPLATGLVGLTEAEIIQQVEDALLVWQTALPGNQEGILAMIDAGASLFDIRDALHSLRQTTTNSANTAYLDPIIVLANQSFITENAEVEKRYRLSGGYEFNMDPKDVLANMLAPADGVVLMQSDGSVVLRVARCAVGEPDVIIEDKHILTYRMRKSIDKADLRNEIRATYIDPTLDFQEQETEPWLNQASIDVHGIQSITLDLHFCPSPSQARRIQKIYAFKLDPAWSGEITTNAYGLDALAQQYIRVRISDLGIDEIFEKLSFETDTLTGVCKMSIRSFPQEALEWDPETEEGTRPRPSGLGQNTNQPPAPTDLDATSDIVDDVIRLVVTSRAPSEGGYFSRDYFAGAYYASSYFGPPDDALSAAERFDLTFDVSWSLDSGASWVPFTSVVTSGGTYTAYYSPAEAATTYDIRARFISAGGLASEYVLTTITTP